MIANLIGRRTTTQRAFFYWWDGLGFLRGGGPYLYRGSAEVVGEVLPYKTGVFHSPTLWWGEDRSWLVVTHIDSTSTYVCGASTLIELVLQSERLEALRSEETTLVDDWTALRAPPHTRKC